MRQFAGKRHFCPADRADHVAAVGDFFHAHALTESHLTELFTGGPIDEADVEFTAHLGLSKRDQGVLLQ